MELFTIEKMEVITTRSVLKAHPDKERIEATLSKLNVGEGFEYPLQPNVKRNIVTAWIGNYAQKENNKILDLKLRESTGLSFSTQVVKDAEKNPVKIKIRRDR